MKMNNISMSNNSSFNLIRKCLEMLELKITKVIRQIIMNLTNKGSILCKVIKILSMIKWTQIRTDLEEKITTIKMLIIKIKKCF